MKRVYKYSIPKDGFIQMPVGAKIVLVGQQDEIPMIWVECKPTALRRERRFWVRNTGRDIPDEAIHVGSFISGDHAHHVYEVTGYE